jgi:isopenicillin-N epimerase
MAIVDHITSGSALVFPVAAIAARCRARGVPLLVDGAHAPGAIDLDIPSLGADWYIGNLHKWCWTPRSCAILWVAPERQASVKPATISWGSGEGFLREFDVNATHDPTPALAAPEGIAMMREIGVDAVRRYNHAFARDGARALAARWGTTFDTPESMIGTMAAVGLPERSGTTDADAVALRAALLYQDRIEVQLTAWRGRLRVRISGQIYNDGSDLEALGAAVDARVR